MSFCSHSLVTASVQKANFLTFKPANVTPSMDRGKPDLNRCASSAGIILLSVPKASLAEGN